MTGHQPGEWPVDEPVDLIPDDLYVKRAAERGRHEIVLGSIRAQLEEQPSPVAVLTAVRVWINEVIALGDEVAREKRKTA
ncbi:hypothetical protein CW362_39810 [Streptomyces populi]|uniref:CopG family transcriptional regulator n=1 Tax=Streptomyces populi TaxID=2058924 RepID=A0A2I0SCB7_9ACTN|nr:hypothetical protein [Streptomyces populi]PKT67560.1 hypothetical protein CW362_39810 [Streptomyces populi]